MLLGNLLSTLFIAFVTGALARFALPGPDPMPPWLTIAIGLVASAIGFGIVLEIGGRKAASWGGLASFCIAVGLVVIYRRFVQKRPLWGKDAYRFPERGFGVEQQRERLQKLGIDPNALRPDPAKFERARLEAMLQELHRAGLLDDDELAAKRTALEHR